MFVLCKPHLSSFQPARLEADPAGREEEFTSSSSLPPGWLRLSVTIDAFKSVIVYSLFELLKLKMAILNTAENQYIKKQYIFLKQFIEKQHFVL